MKEQCPDVYMPPEEVQRLLAEEKAERLTELARSMSITTEDMLQFYLRTFGNEE